MWKDTDGHCLQAFVLVACGGLVPTRTSMGRLPSAEAGRRGLEGAPWLLPVTSVWPCADTAGGPWTGRAAGAQLSELSRTQFSGLMESRRVSLRLVQQQDPIRVSEAPTQVPVGEEAGAHRPPRAGP